MHGNKGFTLVEILIAAVILFSVVTTGSLLFRTSLRASEKATVAAKIATAMPSVMEMIRDDLFAGIGKGQGEFGRLITYSWHSEVEHASRDIVSSYDERTKGLEYGFFLLSLHNVFVTLTYEERGADHQEQYEYQELTWTK